MAKALRSIVVSLLVIGLFLLSPGTSEVFIARAQASEHLGQPSLESYMSQIQRFRDAIDRRAFDVDALAFELAFEDAVAIAEFVRTNIAFEQYSGLLRGAQGTLMSRAGNALDQAVLLAVLLGDAGYDTRIVRSRLRESSAAGLLERMELQSTPYVPLGDVEAMRRIVEDLAEMAGQDPRTAVEEFEASILSDRPTDVAGRAAADAEADFVLDILATRGVMFPDIYDEIVAEAQDYFFVESRLSPASEWQAFHPAFDRDTILDSADVEPVEFFASSIPASLQHRVRFQVFNERLVGSELETTPVMNEWERPTANLAGQLITYTNLPDGVSQPDDLGRIQEALESTRFFFPRFNGGMPSGGVAFDLAGNHVPPDAAQSVAAGVFKAVGDSFNRAAGALGALGDDDADAGFAMSLVGQFAEITLISPDGGEQTHVRRVFDLLEPGSRRAGQPRLAIQAEALDAAVGLVHEFAILVVGGGVPAGFVLDRLLEDVLASQAVFAELQNGRFDNEAMWSQLDASPSTFLHLNLIAGFDSFRVPDVTLYRSAPTVLSLETGFVQAEETVKGQIQVDIVSNGRRAFDRADGRFRQDVVVRAGVWETYAEQLDLGDLDVRSLSAFDSLREARMAGDAFLVLDVSDLGSVHDVLAWDADRLRELEADLADGALVVVPQDLATTAGSSGAWWLVDEQTGQTVGAMETGRGGETLEFMVLVGYAFIVVFAVCALVITVVNFSLNGLWDKTTFDEVDPNDVATPRQIGFCVVAGLTFVGAGTVALFTASWIPVATWTVGFLLGGLNTLFTPPSW